MIPFDHQRASADTLVALLSKRKSAADCSETGTGKTVSALSAAEALNIPFLVVCPKNVKSHWRTWISEMGLLSQCLSVLGWEEAKLGLHPDLFHPKTGFFKEYPEHALVIFDEAHRAKNYKSQNAKMVQQARRQGLHLLLLSATLIQSPMNLSGLAYPLGLIPSQRGWFDYARSYGVGINRWGGYDDMSTREHRLRLHTLLSNIGVRVKREDIPDFREGVYQADLLDAGDVREKIAREYETLQSEILKLQTEGAHSATILTARLRGRQAIELLKAPMFRQAAYDHLEQGAKVALFLNFTDTVSWLAGEPWDWPFSVITGQTSQKARDEALAKFQGHPGPMLLICNIACMSEGVSLHDTDGFERISLISPGEKATDLIQAMGRNVRTGARSSGVNRILFVANTVEQVVYNNTRAKIRAVSNLMDGDLDLFPQLSNHPCLITVNVVIPPNTTVLGKS